MHSNSITQQDAIALLFKDGLSKGRHPEFQIVSSSMHPVLQPGDRIFVKEYSVSNLDCGDIVVYKLKNHIIAHRFLYLKNNSHFITQGDNTLKIDAPIANEALLGKIFLVDKHGTKVDLETKKWQLTNNLLGRILLLKLERENKKNFTGLASDFYIILLKIYCLVINSEYRKILQTRKKPLTLEKKLLKICTKKELSAEDINFIQDASKKNIDWDKLAWLAEYNSVAPLVFINLAKIQEDYIPEEIIQRLKNTYTESFLKTAPIYDDLSKLLKELNSLALKVIVLKGCSLAEQLYGDFSLRPMKDIDILVKKQDWPKIKELLEQLNFKTEKDLLELENLLGAPSDWHLCYRNARNTKIEFKFNLFILDFPDFDSSDYWQEAIPIKVNNIETLSLSVEDQIIYLSSRMINVGFRNLLWFCDLRELINTYSGKIDWNKISVKAKKKKVEVALYNSLLILNKELDIKIPDSVFDCLKPSFIKEKIFNTFYSLKYPLFLLPENIFVPNPIISLCLVFGKFSLRPKDIAKLIQYASGIIFPPSEYIYYRYNLPKKRGALFYWYLYRLRKFVFRFMLLGKVFNKKPKYLLS